MRWSANNCFSQLACTLFLLTFWLVDECAAVTEKATSTATSFHENAMLSRLEASILSECALVDKETGRIFWEGGSSSTLSASLRPRLQNYGLSHTKTTVLSLVLLLAALGSLAGVVRQKLELSEAFNTAPRPIHLSIIYYAIQWTILKVPRFDNWFILAVVVLYLLEAYTCNTKRYLKNAINSPGELEEYIEKIREQPPEVTWKVRSFHYESFPWLSPKLLAQSIRQFLRSETEEEVKLQHSRPSTLVRRKVVSNYATGSYQYQNCVDKTIAGVWKRAQAVSASPAPFTKILLSKILVLSNAKARKDYFRQQSEFVTANGQGDEYAEFSTSIEVNGFKPKMLAVRPVEGVTSARLFRLHLFWIFTLLGLTLPYRIWFARHCDELRVTVVKETSADPPEKSSRGWLFSSPAVTPKEQAEQEVFRSLMQDLKLYGSEEASLENQNATAAVLEDVEYTEMLGDMTSEADESKERPEEVESALVDEKLQEMKLNETVPNKANGTEEDNSGNETSKDDVGSAPKDDTSSNSTKPKD